MYNVYLKIGSSTVRRNNIEANSKQEAIDVALKTFKEAGLRLPKEFEKWCVVEEVNNNASK